MAFENGSSPDKLLADARNGHRESLGTLLELYRSHLQVLAGMQLRGRLRARVNPSDVVQETFLQASCHFDDFRGDSEQELLDWLRSILRRAFLRIVHRQVLARKRTIYREVALQDEAIEQLPAPSILAKSLVSPGSSPSSPVRRREESTTLMERLGRLPAPFRQVLALRNLEGLPFAEVAQRMGRSPGAVRILWLRALDRLRREYPDEDRS
jgi:RNA polymerase sigma-70 factor (ECF subfamily)